MSKRERGDFIYSKIGLQLLPTRGKQNLNAFLQDGDGSCSFHKKFLEGIFGYERTPVPGSSLSLEAVDNAKRRPEGFPCASVVKNLPADAGEVK